MFRSFTLACLAFILSFSAVFAQNVPPQPVPIKIMPEMLALFDESLQSLTQAEPNVQAGGLFQLLGFAVNFEDHAPAQRAVDALLALADSFESEELRSQLYEGVANAYCDLEKYPEAVEVLNRITPPESRYEPQAIIGITIVRKQEQDKTDEPADEPTEKPFDVTALLRQAVTGAAAAKNVDIEFGARIFLGRELALQGKKEESAAAFAEVTKGLAAITDADKKNDTIDALFQSQVQYDQMDGAMETFKLVTDPEHKRLCVRSLIRQEKFAEAETLIQSLPEGEWRDTGYVELAVATIKTITDEKIGELAALIAAEERREQFLQRVTVELQKNDRSEAAMQTAKRLKDPISTKLLLLRGEVETLIAKKQFTEALASVVKSEVDEAIQRFFKRQILLKHYQETHEESVIALMAETYTPEEKMTLAELNESAKQAAAVTNQEEQMDVFLEVLQGQLTLLDLPGARQTMQLLSEQLDKDKDVARLVQYRLLLARLQSEMQEKQGVKENLAALTQALAAVSDLKDLKGLLPEPPQQPEAAPNSTADGKIKLDLPAAGQEPAVDESAIRDQLFQIYLMTANLLANVDAEAESAAAFEKAKELAKAETVAERKSEKLLLLSQILAEEEQE